MKETVGTVGEFQIGQWNVRINADTGEIRALFPYFGIDNKEYSFVCKSEIERGDRLHVFDTSNILSKNIYAKTPQEASAIAKNWGFDIPINEIGELTDKFLQDCYSEFMNLALKPWRI